MVYGSRKLKFGTMVPRKGSETAEERLEKRPSNVRRTHATRARARIRPTKYDDRAPHKHRCFTTIVCMVPCLFIGFYGCTIVQCARMRNFWVKQ